MFIDKSKIFYTHGLPEKDRIRVEGPRLHSGQVPVYAHKHFIPQVGLLHSYKATRGGYRGVFV